MTKHFILTKTRINLVIMLTTSSRFHKHVLSAVIGRVANSFHGLSYNEALTILKPFYFIVHPDLFGKYPVAQKINENSLKKLNEYLQAIKKQQQLDNISVPFYIRNQPVLQTLHEKKLQVQGNFTVVNITLSTQSLTDVVSAVLQTCNLPLDDFAKLNATQNYSVKQDSVHTKYDPSRSRPIKWHESFYTAYGIPNPDEKIPRPGSKNLRTWLERNASKVQQLQAAHEALSQETERLKTQVMASTGLQQIKWESSWGFKQFRTSLLSLQRLHSRYSSQLQLQGQSLMFGHENGVSVGGSIIVKSDEVAETWLPLLKSVSTHQQVLHTLPMLEQQVSSLLNNACIVRRVNSPVILALDYNKQLKKLISLLQEYISQNPGCTVSQDLHDVEIVLECTEGPLHINNQGQILIPSVYSSPFMIVDFLNDNADRARLVKMRSTRATEDIKHIIDDCFRLLHLRSLKRDFNVTSEEMRSCCEQLIKQKDELLCFLPTCRIKVCRFYSVMSDGEICIPWDWATLL